LLLTLHFNRGSQREKRKALRRNATDAEQTLWQHLRGKQLGMKFRRQYSVDAYGLDFYAPRSKLAIEVDGDSHFSAAAMAYDQGRTADLQRFGIEVLRFTNVEIRENLDGVLTRIGGEKYIGRSYKPRCWAAAKLCHMFR
jgi:very-short-patch-repair endonuclease